MKNLTQLKGFAKIIYFIVGGYIILGGLMFWYYATDHKVEAGQFGDMFGGITALFSSLSFAGVLYTIILQRKELIQSRKELKLTRLEFETQNETSQLQRFENTYYNAINLFLKVKDELHIWVSVDEGDLYGNEAVDDFLGYNLSRFKTQFENYKIEFHKVYVDFYNNGEKPKYELSHYFRPMMSVIRILIFTKMDDVKTFMYFQIFTGLLTREQLAAMYWYVSLSNDVLPAEKKFVQIFGRFNEIYGDDFIPDGSYSKMIFGDTERLKSTS